ncbi:MAG: hypothetical protein R3F17_00260 [Planctomycetota bacterium]
MEEPYEEGFARPQGGVRTILAWLRSRYLELGGQLAMNSGVAEIARRRARGVRLDSGAEIRCERIPSGPGGDHGPVRRGKSRRAIPPRISPAMTFVEHISLLDRPVSDLGFDRTICFFNTEESLAVRAAREESFSVTSG